MYDKFEFNLISAVKKHECIYDKTRATYRSKEKKVAAWAQIAAHVRASVEQCQGRWRSLRDRYVREVVNHANSNWRYAKALGFLNGHVTPRRKYATSTYDRKTEVEVEGTEDTTMHEELSFEEEDLTSTIEQVLNDTTEEVFLNDGSCTTLTITKASAPYDVLQESITEYVVKKKEPNSPSSNNATFEEKLISAIQRHPCIYDKTKKIYRNRTMKEEAWMEVAAETGEKVEQCANRWRSLRDRYVKEIGAGYDSMTSNWKYMKAVEFLKNYVGRRKYYSPKQTNFTFVDESTNCLPQSKDQVFFDEEELTCTLPAIEHKKIEEKRSPNAEFYSVIDGFMLKMPEEVQDDLKMEITQLVFSKYKEIGGNRRSQVYM